MRGSPARNQTSNRQQIRKRLTPTQRVFLSLILRGTINCPYLYNSFHDPHFYCFSMVVFARLFTTLLLCRFVIVCCRRIDRRTHVTSHLRWWSQSVLLLLSQWGCCIKICACVLSRDVAYRWGACHPFDH